MDFNTTIIFVEVLLVGLVIAYILSLISDKLDKIIKLLKKEE